MSGRSAQRDENRRKKTVPRYPLIGAHVSIGGGVENAPANGAAIGCVCVQIFAKSSRRWSAPPLTNESAVAFKQACKDASIGPVIGHTGYLINLAAHDKAIHAKSFKSFQDELDRSLRLGLPGLVVHPGTHGGVGEKIGLRQVATDLNKLIKCTPDSNVRILLETTAGQGSSLGYRFQQIAEIMSRVKDKSRVGVCFDTAHVFAAGYDIRTEDACGRVLEEFDQVIGLKRLVAFHFNDSKSDFASRVDRHENIGLGKIGDAPFRFILRDDRFKDLPKILETPKGKKSETEWDMINLRRLRRLASKR